jgi:hypothetical protein
LWPWARAGQGHGHGAHYACRPCGVHDVAHVPALDAWPCVLRGNVPSHRFSGCGCVGLTRTSGPLRVGCMSHPAQFGISPVCMLTRYYRSFSPTFVVKGGLDQYIRLLESIPLSLG